MQRVSLMQAAMRGLEYTAINKSAPAREAGGGSYPQGRVAGTTSEQAQALNSSVFRGPPRPCRPFLFLVHGSIREVGVAQVNRLH